VLRASWLKALRLIARRSSHRAGALKRKDAVVVLQPSVRALFENTNN
jgi:hypothetical protein